MILKFLILKILEVISQYRDKVLEEMKVGPITYSTESLQYTFSPQWLQWFKPNFTYNSNYTWNKPLNSVLNAANINLNQNKSVNFAISPTEFIESFYTPASKRSKNKNAPRSRSRQTNNDEIFEKDKDTKKDSKKFKNNFVLERIYNESKKIEPLSFTVTNVRNNITNGVNDDIPLSYRLGLKNDLYINSIPEVDLILDIKILKDFQVRSGIRFNPKTSLSISFNESISSNINGYNIDIRSISRDLLLLVIICLKVFHFRIGHLGLVAWKR